MNFLELAKLRYSSRNYSKQKLEPEKINALLEAARIAPSAANRQPWQFIVVQNEDNLKQLCGAYKGKWLNTAPLIIVCCGTAQTAWVRKQDAKNYADIDVSIAVDHITLQATALGLASCWICAFDTDKVKKLLHIPPDVEPIAMLPIGYPNDKADTDRHTTDRKKMSEIVHYEQWQ